MTGFAPLGGAPLGDSGAGLYLEAITNTLSVSTLVTPADIRLSILEAITVGEDLLSFDIAGLVEALRASGTIPSSTITFRPSPAELLSFDDALQVAWAMALSDALTGAAAIVEQPYKVAAMVDILRAAGLVDGRLTAVQALVTALSIESLTVSGWTASLTESPAFGDALTNTAQLLAPLVDTAGASDITTPAIRMVALGDDRLEAVDTPAGLLTLLADAEDELILYATFRIGATEFSGWVLNTTNKAASEYRDFPWESVATCGGSTYAAGDGGIVELTGNDDDGDPITAFITTGLSDFGSQKQKRYPDVYFSVTGAGQLVFKVITTSDNGEKVEDWYLQEPDNRTGVEVREGRVKLGRGLRSRWWQLTVANKAGGTLDLTSLEWRPLVLDRRL